MLSIMNAALLAQGQLEIVSENDGSMEYRVMASNWPGIVEAELEDGAYRYTKQETELVSRQPGKFGFDDGYIVPDAALHVRQVWVQTSSGDRREMSWTQDATAVYLNNDDGCWIEYVICPEPDLWGANFVRGVQKRLEAVISRAIREEFNEAEALDSAAEMYFQRARTISSKSRSGKTFYKKGPIASARNRRG